MGCDWAPTRKGTPAHATMWMTSSKHYGKTKEAGHRTTRVVQFCSLRIFEVLETGSGSVHRGQFGETEGHFGETEGTVETGGTQCHDTVR